MPAKRKLFATPVTVRSSKKSKATVSSLTRIQGYPGDQVKTLILPAGTFNLSSAASTGVINTAYTIDPVSNIAAWSTRIQPLFDEYRVTKAVFEVYPVALTAGLTSMFFCDENIGTPTLTEAQQRMGALIKNNLQPYKPLRYTWKLDDYTDATWRLTSSSYQSSTFNVYTDLANFGTPASTLVFIVRPIYTVQLRGIKST